MTRSSLETFLAPIREALGRDGTTPVDPETIETGEDVARLVQPNEDLVHRFASEALEVGCTVETVAEDEIAAALVGLITGKSIILSCVDDRLRSIVTESGDEIGSTIIPTQAGAAVEPAFSADVTVTDVDAAVAETGSLVFSSGPGRSRLAHAIAPIHIVILRTGLIVADLVDLFDRFREEGSGVVLATGPSKTADIEGILVTGVHGPGRVHILLVHDSG